MVIKSVRISAILFSFILMLLQCDRSIADEFHLLDTFNSPDFIWYGAMTTNGPYMAIGDASEQGIGIDILNISDPSNMQWICRIQTNHISYDINWNGNFLYDPSAYNGFYIYDISNFNNPILAYNGTGPYSIAFSDVAIRNNLGIFGGDEGMLIYDISDPYSPVLEFESNQLGFYRIILGNNIACIMRWTLDVAILDISQFDYPSEVSRFNYSYVSDIALDPAERYIYLTNWDNGLAIYDISNTSAPQFISETPMPGRPPCLDVEVSKFNHNYVFISAYTGGLWAVDVSDPYNPIPTANYLPPDQSHCVLTKQELIFLTIPSSLYSFSFDYETGTKENDLIMPHEYITAANYPNPFNSSTTIKYHIPENGRVLLEIYSELGRKVETLVEGFQTSGYHTGSWNAGGYSSGIYFYRIKTDSGSATRKITLLK